LNFLFVSYNQQNCYIVIVSLEPWDLVLTLFCRALSPGGAPLKSGGGTFKLLPAPVNCYVKLTKNRCLSVVVSHLWTRCAASVVYYVVRQLLGVGVMLRSACFSTSWVQLVVVQIHCKPVWNWWILFY